eukprot:scaffold50534_cov23-Tisochrysis_lutea.AAC.2
MQAPAQPMLQRLHTHTQVKKKHSGSHAILLPWSSQEKPALQSSTGRQNTSKPCSASNLKSTYSSWSSNELEQQVVS